MKETRYINHRKKNLKECKLLVEKRDAMTKKISKVRKELAAWDRALLE